MRRSCTMPSTNSIGGPIHSPGGVESIARLAVWLTNRETMFFMNLFSVLSLGPASFHRTSPGARIA